MGHRLSTWAVVACAALLAACAPAYAASLQVSPTSVTLQAERNADGLTLRNTGTTTLHAQVRVYRWTQHDGDDRLEPTRDIAASPPMVELAPGAQQLVRVIRLTAPPTAAESAYRLIVDELPLESTGEAARPGLQFVLRYSVPVFLMPAGADEVAPVLRVRVGRDSEGPFIEIDNSGQRHAQVADLAYVDAGGGRHAVAPGLSGYVLPGARKRWPLPSTFTVSNTGTFKARINGEPVERSLSLDSTAP